MEQANGSEIATPTQGFLSKKLLGILFGAILLVFLIVGSVVFLLSRNRAVPETAQSTNTQKQTEPVTQKPGFASVSFSNWELSTTLPAETATPAAVWTFEQPSQEKALGIAANLGMEPPKVNKSSVLSRQTKTGESSLFLYELKNGSFLYDSQEGIPLGGQVNNTTLLSFLQKLDLADPQMEVMANYKRKSNENVTYYEIHHSWEKAGLPILNQLGLAVFPKESKLTELEIGGSTGQVDENIYATSDKFDGFARPDVFNTIVIGVNTSGNVVYLKSKMRQFAESSPVTGMITAEQAFEELKKGNYKDLYPMPEGETELAYDSVFPDKKGVAQNAEILEVRLAYLESPMDESQLSLEPYWIFRGKSTLENGQAIQFVASVEAVNSSLSLLHTFRSLVQLPFQVEASSNTLAQMNQGTIGEDDIQNRETPMPPTPTRTLTPVASPTRRVTAAGTPTTAPEEGPYGATVTPTPEGWQSDMSDEQIRNLSESMLRNCGENLTGAPGIQQRVQPYTVSGYTVITTRTREDGDIHHFVLLPPDFEITTDVLQLIGSFFGTLSEERVFEILSSLRERMLQGNLTCAVMFRVTPIHPESPTIFYYGDTPIRIIPKGTAYSIPALKNGAWEIVPEAHILRINNVQRSTIYYEYLAQMTPWIVPQEGWVVEYRKLAAFVEKTGTEMQLTESEKKALKSELKLLFEGEKSQKLLLSIVDEPLVERIAPFTVTDLSGNPVEGLDTQRVMFTGFDPDLYPNVKTPVLQPVERSPLFLLEFGLYDSMQ